MKITIVAPSCPLSREAAEAVVAIATGRGDCEIVVHPQCFLTDGHFAGPDSARLDALRGVMADKTVDAIWFGRGGYGSNRVAAAVVQDLPSASRSKVYLGYSDSGFLHGAMHRAGLEVAWGPMPQDILRDGGDEAIHRSLDWLVRRDASTLEPGLQGPAMAFNLTVLSMMLGTPLEPDLTGVDLLIEEVSEHHYEIDRLMFHLVASHNVRSVRQIRLGRVSDVPANDPPFGSKEEQIVSDWCKRAGIHFGGRADIGHDAANRVVPFPYGKS